MHDWLDFVTKLQKYTSSAYSSWKKSVKTEYAVVANQLPAANADVIACQMEEFKNSDLLWFCIV